MSARSAKPKERLDLLLQSRGLAESRERARSLILSGSVLVDGKKVEKAGAQVKEDAEIVLRFAEGVRELDQIVSLRHTSIVQHFRAG
mgnify:CR=1 FL=1